MEQLTTPDLYNVYQQVQTDSNGEYVLDEVILHLPSKTGYVIFNSLPTTGSVLANGSAVVAGQTQISITDISSDLLIWDAGAANANFLLDINYYVYDTSGQLISLLQPYYPLDVVLDVVENIEDGGNFNTGADAIGVDTDGGDFDVGTLVTNGYSFDGGDFDTGERVGVAPPPMTTADYYLDGQLDPEAQSIITLLDENLDPIQTSDMPNTNFYAETVVSVDMNLDINYTVECEIVYVSKYFEGFDYGSVTPDFGYDIDYGSIDTENTEGYDFNAIENYVEPTPSSSVT